MTYDLAIQRMHIYVLDPCAKRLRGIGFDSFVRILHITGCQRTIGKNALDELGNLNRVIKESTVNLVANNPTNTIIVARDDREFCGHRLIIRQSLRLCR